MAGGSSTHALSTKTFHALCVAFNSEKGTFRGKVCPPWESQTPPKQWVTSTA